MSRSPQEHKIICVSCGFGNYPTAHFCVECEAPLTAHAVVDPFDTIKTTGWAYRKSQDKPRSLVVVIGIWLIFGPMGLICAIELLSLLSAFFRGEVHGAQERLLLLGAFALLGVGLYISTTIIRRTTRGYLQEQERRRREKVEPIDDEDDDETGGEFDDDFDDDDD